MRWITTLLAFACAIFVTAQTDGLAQSPQGFPNINIALHSIRQVYQISTGLETDLADSDRAPVTLDLSGKDVARVFDALVTQRSAYVWNVQDGVYDLYPSRQAESLSQLTIANFVVTNATLRQTQSALFNLPEVREWLTQHHAARNGLINSTAAMPPRGAPRPEPQTMSLGLSNVQLRTILNQIITKFGRTQWIIGHVAGDGGYAEYVSIEP